MLKISSIYADDYGDEDEEDRGLHDEYRQTLAPGGESRGKQGRVEEEKRKGVKEQSPTILYKSSYLPAVPGSLLHTVAG